ncbi:D-sedoheptulose 7-phosphate isomerase [Chitinimonas koreensis]|uniref:D-sedoheptulose 7-phosphate isomerase n=1 Tax=Chitinimonas koreensis TaxID=356302 RepID=UPI0004013911|nr:D-sedoheptulose 7-phosphate isomerase [Chitinimonas koreensis]QNM96814.1 D-sedoheptulose 7-phosphate isomerase [Chitinimonas koreensis]
MSAAASIRASLDEARALLERVLADDGFVASVEAAAQLLVAQFKDGRKVISAGNGGSHCDAMHFAEELTGRYRDDRPALGAIAVSDPSHLSCVGNDYGFDHVFSRFIEGVGQAGDVFLGISTSGNSKNIVRGVEAARARGMKVVLLLGKDGGHLRGQADVEIVVPHFGYADRIQEIHIKVIHILIGLVEQGMGYVEDGEK